MREYVSIMLDTIEYASITLNTIEYVSITLNTIEYGSIYLKKQSAKYVRILNVSDAVDSARSPHKLLSSYQDMYLEHCQTFKIERFAKRIMSECRCAIRNFSEPAGRRFVELGHFDKKFIKNTRKRGPAGKHFGFFSPIYS